MSDYTYIDLLDEVDCSDRCEAVIALCELVDKLVADIQFLELECISTRHLLSQYMDKEEGELLRMDILSHLTGRYSGESAYELYKREYHVQRRGSYGIPRLSCQGTRGLQRKLALLALINKRTRLAVRVHWQQLPGGAADQCSVTTDLFPREGWSD